MNVPRALVVSILLMSCGTAQASEWVLLGENAETKVFIHPSSIQIAGSIRRSWSKQVFDPQTKKGSGKDAGKWVERNELLRAFDCSQFLLRFEALTIYFEDTTFDSLPAEAFVSEPWKPPVPSSFNAAEMYYVCNWHEGTP